MSDSIIFLVGVGVTVALSLTVVVYLHRFLRAVLLDICGTRERADFWAAFSNVTLVLVPLICALFRHPRGGTSVLLEIGDQLRWSLLGFVGSVLIVGFVLALFIPRAQPAK